MSSSSSSSLSSSSLWEDVIFESSGIQYSSPSLVIDIANLNDLETDTKNAFGVYFPHQVGWVSRDRLRGNFAIGSTEWGFQQANGKTSSAVVLAGEKVVIYVATKGHGVGYMGEASNGPVFSKTKIRITLRDLYRNVDKSVVFDSFSKPADHPDRYFLWEVGKSDSWVARSRGGDTTCGMYVLSISDESDFYKRADWTEPIDPSEGMSFPKPESSLMVSAYDWRDIVSKVVTIPSKNVAIMIGADFRNGTIDPDTTDTEHDVFDTTTVFPEYDVSGLTDEQKTVVIRDNAMFLLSSQIPVLPADSPMAPIIGMGMTSVVVPDQTLREPSVRPSEISLASVQPRRTFSLSGRPVATNVLDDLVACASERGQGYLSAFDPVRVLASDTNEVGASNLDGGLSWVIAGKYPTGLSVTGDYEVQCEILVGDETHEIDTTGDWVSSSSSDVSSSSSSSQSTWSSLSSVSTSSSSSLSDNSSSSSSPSTLSSISMYVCEDNTCGDPGGALPGYASPCTDFSEWLLYGVSDSNSQYGSLVFKVRHTGPAGEPDPITCQLDIYNSDSVVYFGGVPYPTGSIVATSGDFEAGSTDPVIIIFEQVDGSGVLGSVVWSGYVGGGGFNSNPGMITCNS